MHKAFILLIFWIITALLILRILHSRQCVFWSVLSRHPSPGLHDHHDYYCSLIRFLPLLASSYPQAAWAAVFEHEGTGRWPTAPCLAGIIFQFSVDTLYLIYTFIFSSIFTSIFYHLDSILISTFWPSFIGTSHLLAMVFFFSGQFLPYPFFFSLFPFPADGFQENRLPLAMNS